MTLNEYQSQAMTTNAVSSNNETYSLFGLIAEVGEIADKVAKAKRKMIISIKYDRITPILKGDPRFFEFEEGMKKELGDVLWFCAHLAHRFGWSLEDVAQMNLEKLAKRKAEGTIITHTDH